ncbi:hypothetical protein [Lacticaseibacillus nasuensis]|uniref:hypothetical protein n=1 Tax=Lacticaseibacillus nasuensis TaxID=944671 RepID=UPI0015853902|nr:hypothetical protein [Lacticaseibacillus nasuensis]
MIVDAFATRQEATQHLDLAARLVGLYRNTESPRLASFSARVPFARQTVHSSSLMC